MRRLWAAGLGIILAIPLCAACAGAVSRGIHVSARTKTGKEIPLYTTSYALVVGNGDYTGAWDPLPGASKDAERVAQALEKQGFSVQLERNVTRQRFDEAFGRFVIERGQKEDSRLLFYYAGHGHTEKLANGEDLGYLVMRGAPDPKEDPVGFVQASVDMQAIVTQAKRIQARHVLFIFDSCFSGSILNLREKVQPEEIAEKVSLPVRQFITAGRAEEPVPDQSYFTQAFLDLIEGREREPIPDGYITGEELGLYLKTKVPHYFPAQHPQHGKISDPRLDKGDFVFVLAGGGSATSEEPQAAAGAATGSLHVETMPPNAVVFVNGERKGGAPVKLEGLAPGNYGVRAEAQGYDSQERQVLVREGRRMELKLVLERTVKAGSVAVASTPAGAEWYLNGTLSGKTPDNLPQVAPGQHRVDVRLEGYEDWTGTVTVRAGEEARVEASLRAKPRRAGPAQAPAPPPPPSPAQAPVPAQRFASEAQWRETKTGLDFVMIPGGQFTMGTKDGGRNERPPHQVRVPDFWMARTEVTQAQWVAVMGKNPSRFSKCDDCPVEQVSWEDVQEFLRRTGCRLPTEAEWEYAAGGGSRHQKWPGTDGERELAGYAWYAENAGRKTHPVGTKQPNAFGLFDMAGNVAEWCADWLDNGYYRNSPVDNPAGPPSGRARVLRGGSWHHDADGVRVGAREGARPGARDETIGFRPVSIQRP